MFPSDITRIRNNWSIQRLGDAWVDLVLRVCVANACVSHDKVVEVWGKNNWPVPWGKFIPTGSKLMWVDGQVLIAED